MTTYVKRKGRDTWHWCKNCANYPTGPDVVTKHSKPTSGELCNQCKAKDNRGDCRE